MHLQILQRQRRIRTKHQMYLPALTGYMVIEAIRQRTISDILQMEAWPIIQQGLELYMIKKVKLKDILISTQMMSQQWLLHQI